MTTLEAVRLEWRLDLVVLQVQKRSSTGTTGMEQLLPCSRLVVVSLLHNESAALSRQGMTPNRICWMPG